MWDARQNGTRCFRGNEVCGLSFLLGRKFIVLKRGLRKVRYGEAGERRVTRIMGLRGPERKTEPGSVVF